MPSAPAGGVGEFCAELKRLWVESGEPPLKSLEGRCGVSDSQLSAILNGKVKRPPSWSIVSAFVAACAENAKRRHFSPSLTVDLAYWRRRHGALERSAPRRPPVAKAARDCWGELAEKHAVWKSVNAAERIRPQVVDLAEHLSRRHRTAVEVCAGDPWVDPTFVERMTSRSSGLLTFGLQDPQQEFSPAEASLLVLSPMLHQVRIAQSAAALIGVSPTDLRPASSPGEDRAHFERFISGQQQRRLVARVDQIGARSSGEALDGIGWWLFHRWIGGRAVQPESATATAILRNAPIDDRSLRKVLVGTLDRVVRLFRLPPEDLRSPERLALAASTSHLGGTAEQQAVRERLVGLLSVVAHALAIELTTLPTTVVEHLGIPDPVDLEQLRTTLDEAEWAPVPIGIGLVAECHHEAVLEALREHAARTDVVLGAVHAAADNDLSLQPLLRLPARASADRVEPAQRADGRPAFAVPVAKFRLDESRVRELLMGEQLYGDKSLAVRELYQNALDACRYRRARNEYRAAVTGWRSDWVGGIRFDQGVDEGGRHYLRCADNGIGMGEAELRELFSQAGMRFADRPEFQEEQAQWAEHGVRLYPNSRFGIGVMSYFMLADEIEVTTCRMDRHGGRPGPRLQVRIAGPGHLFRIKQLEDHGLEPGTAVTLYLRHGDAAPSCVEVLQRLLGIAEFTTRAEHDGLEAEWRPFEFRGRTRRPGESDGIEASGTLVPVRPGENGQVIWCERGGALLADGLYVRPAEPRGLLKTLGESVDIRGAVVNLTRAWTPRLTVDRTAVLEDASDHVKAVLAEAAPDLVRDGGELLSFAWLRDVAETSPLLADVVTEAAIEAGHRMEFNGVLADVAVTGCFPGDVVLIGHVDFVLGLYDWGNFLPQDFPENLLLWRALAHRGDMISESHPSSVKKLLPALPSDVVLVGKEYLFWHGVVKFQTGHLLAKAAELGISPRAVARRMSALGFEVEEPDRLPDKTSIPGVDVMLLSKKLDGVRPWLEEEGSVPTGHLMAAQLRTNVPLVEIRRRLVDYSFEVGEISDSVQRFTEEDLVLVSLDGDKGWPWIEDGKPVDLRHVYATAAVLKWTIRRVVERLSMLGFDVPVVDGLDDWSEDLTPAVSSVLRDRYSEFKCLSRTNVMQVGVAWGLPLAEVVDRLTQIGIEVEDIGDLPNGFDERDRSLLRSVGLVTEKRVSISGEVPLAMVVTAADAEQCSPFAVAARLLELGFTVMPEQTAERVFDSVDRTLLGLNEEKSWEWGARYPSHFLRQMVDRVAGADMSVFEALGRLDGMGFEIPEMPWLPEFFSELDRILFKLNNGVLADFALGDGVPLALVLCAVERTVYTPRQALARLVELGIPLKPGAGGWKGEIRADSKLLKQLGSTLWLQLEKIVPIGHLVGMACRYGLTVDEVADRLTALGLRVVDPAPALAELLDRVPVVRP